MNGIQCFLIEPTDETWATWRRVDNGEPSSPNVPGAMWYAPKGYSLYLSQDETGRLLMVQTPGGEWCIDGRANNCTRREDDPKYTKHKCWVRHGEPPNITVDKNGETCGCGCSIGMGDSANYRYHGFLRNGVLEEC